MKVKLLNRVRLLATPWTVAYQAPPSMGFSRQEYWSGVPLLSPRGEHQTPYIEFSLFGVTGTPYVDAMIVNFLLHFLSSYGYLEKANGTPLQYSCLENPMDGGAW